MNKPQSLRDYLCAAIPQLKTDPQQLKQFVESGNIVARSGDSLSFEYRFTLRLILLDFAGSLDMLAIPLLAWLGMHQPDTLQNKDRSAKAVRFESEPRANDKQDVVVELDLTESVIVASDVDASGRQRLTAVHKGEAHPARVVDVELAEWHVHRLA